MTAAFTNVLEVILFTLAGIFQGIRQDFNMLEIAILCGFAIAIKRGFSGRLRFLSGFEALIGRAVHRPVLAYIGLGCAAILVRLALLPLLPIPKPVVADEFSHLLLADTLLHGRVANPTHPLWPHFESLHIVQQPHYVSNYFPGFGAVLSAARFVTGEPWFGVVLLSGICCAVTSWALAGFQPVRWALLGGVLVLLRFSVASYWVDSYYGGFPSAIAGALIAGAFARLRDRASVSMASVFGLGLAILAYTRPYEGFFFALPFAIALASRWFNWRVLLPIGCICGIAAVGFCMYFIRVTGSPLRTTYSISQETYGWPASIAWARPVPMTHRSVEMHRYYEYEIEEHAKVDSVPHFIEYLTFRIQEYWRFFVGPLLTIPLLFIGAVWRSGRLRILILGLAAAGAAVLLEGAATPHYLAPATIAIAAVLVEGMRYLRAWAVNGHRIGLLAARIAIVTMVVVLGLRIVAENIGLPYTQNLNYQSWCCKVRGNYAKYHVIAQLSKEPGKHLVIVTPKRDPNNLFQWIYNDADIDASRIVWARDLGAQENAKLISYFRDRSVWRLDPNVADPHPVRAETGAAAYLTSQNSR